MAKENNPQDDAAQPAEKPEASSLEAKTSVPTNAGSDEPTATGEPDVNGESAKTPEPGSKKNDWIAVQPKPASPKPAGPKPASTVEDGSSTVDQVASSEATSASLVEESRLAETSSSAAETLASETAAEKSSATGNAGAKVGEPESVEAQSPAVGAVKSAETPTERIQTRAEARRRDGSKSAKKSKQNKKSELESKADLEHKAASNSSLQESAEAGSASVTGATSPASATKLASTAKVGGSGDRHPVRSILGVLSGVGLAAVVAAGIVASGLAPDPAGSRPVDLPQAQLPAGPFAAVCPSPPLLLTGTGADTDPQFGGGSASAKTLVTGLVGTSAQGGVPASGLFPMGSDSKASPIAKISDAKAAPAATDSVGTPPVQVSFSRLQGKEISAPSVLRADPVQQQRTTSAGVQVYTATDGDLRGMAATSCQLPSNESWLVGASTEVGRTSILMLSNPSSTPAKVRLELWGDAGRVQSTGTKDILVAPGTTKNIVLSALAQNQKQLSVHVQSSGAAVSAVVQESVLRALTPGGVDYITPAAVPGQRQVIPGVQTIAPGLAKDISGQSGYADAQTSLSVAVPGAADTIVQVKVLGESGQVPLPNGGVFTAKAGGTTALPLSGVPAGTYTVEVTADATVLATVRSVTGTKVGDPTDLAFSSAAAKISDNQLVTLPQGVGTKLALGAPSGNATLSVTPIGTDGKLQAAKSLTVNAGRTLIVDPKQVAGGDVSGLLLSASGSAVYGAQVISAADGAQNAVIGIPASIASQPSVGVGLGY